MTLKESLRMLAASGPQQASDRVEAELLKAFRKRRRRTRWFMWVPAAGVAAALAVGISWFVLRPGESPKPEMKLARIEAPVVPQIGFARPSMAPASTRRQRAIRAPRPPMVPGEIATRFYSLPEAEAGAPLEHGTIVRVQLPRSALTMVGFPLNQGRAAELVKADVLLGQDGVARAVRFVQ